MLNDLEALALNVFFILSLLFFHQVLIIDNPKVKNKSSFAWYMSVTILTVILCMTFPFSMGPGFIFDLRAVPFIVGSLYGGTKLYLILLSVISVYRFILGGDGFYTQLMIVIALFPLFMYFIPRFAHYQIRQKIGSAAILALIYSIITCGGLFWSTRTFSAEYLIFSFMYTTVLLLSVWMTTYFIEMMRNNHLLREAAHHFEKLKVVSELAASVSHEVRNPLTSVSGFIQMLREDPDLPVNKRKEFLDISYEELLRAQSIISDYLNFAKPNIEKLQPLELSQEIKYVLKVATSLSNMQQIQLLSTLQENCWVLGDSQKIRQCIINLVKNGIESIGAVGTLSVNLYSQGEEIYIDIRDSGKGMTPQQVNRLGNPYYSTKEKGTGLGTMVAFSIVQGMGGKTEVDSKLGEGTVIHIILPKLKSL